MITKVQVNGFRSLHKFSLEISPGINVLVGPNGAGKTNIIAFFEFISNFVARDIPFAISAAGGTRNVFSAETTTERDAYFEFEIEGTAPIDSWRDQPSRRKFVHYRYSAEVRFDFDESLISISSEKLEFSKTIRSTAVWPKVKRPLEIGVEIFRPTPKDTLVAELTGRHVSISYSDGFPMSMVLEQSLRNGFAHISVLSDDIPHYDEILRAIRRDLFSGYNYNVLPDAAKSPEELSTPFGIRKNGSGLSATLFNLWLASIRHHRVDYLRSTNVYITRDFRNTFADVVRLTKLVNNSVSNIEVKQNIELGKYIGSLEIESGAKEPGDLTKIPIPFVSASDGTIKWICLVTALLTKSEMLAIEEPENFLHPTMQAEMVKLCREQTTLPSRPRFLLLSTHSETLINNCRPEELLIVHLEDGRTVANRPDNASEISDLIQETGFGLGYFYIANAVG